MLNTCTQNELYIEVKEYHCLFISKSVLSKMKDITPANIFVSAEGIIRLGDLSLGRFFGSKITSAQSMVGTP